jgi:hypothetical protein
VASFSHLSPYDERLLTRTDAPPGFRNRVLKQMVGLARLDVGTRVDTLLQVEGKPTVQEAPTP